MNMAPKRGKQNIDQKIPLSENRSQSCQPQERFPLDPYPHQEACQGLIDNSSPKVKTKKSSGSKAGSNASSTKSLDDGGSWVPVNRKARNHHKAALKLTTSAIITSNLATTCTSLNMTGNPQGGKIIGSINTLGSPSINGQSLPTPPQALSTAIPASATPIKILTNPSKNSREKGTCSLKYSTSTSFLAAHGANQCKDASCYKTYADVIKGNGVPETLDQEEFPSKTKLLDPCFSQSQSHLEHIGLESPESNKDEQKNQQEVDLHIQLVVQNEVTVAAEARDASKTDGCQAAEAHLPDYEDMIQRCFSSNLKIAKFIERKLSKSRESFGVIFNLENMKNEEQCQGDNYEETECGNREVQMCESNVKQALTNYSHYTDYPQVRVDEERFVFMGAEEMIQYKQHNDMEIFQNPQTLPAEDLRRNTITFPGQNAISTSDLRTIYPAANEPLPPEVSLFGIKQEAFGCTQYYHNRFNENFSNCYPIMWENGENEQLASEFRGGTETFLYSNNQVWERSFNEPSGVLVPNSMQESLTKLTDSATQTDAVNVQKRYSVNVTVVPSVPPGFENVYSEGGVTASTGTMCVLEDMRPNASQKPENNLGKSRDLQLNRCLRKPYQAPRERQFESDSTNQSSACNQSYDERKNLKSKKDGLQKRNSRVNASDQDNDFNIPVLNPDLQSVPTVCPPGGAIVYMKAGNIAEILGLPTTLYQCRCNKKDCNKMFYLVDSSLLSNRTTQAHSYIAYGDKKDAREVVRRLGGRGCHIRLLEEPELDDTKVYVANLPPTVTEEELTHVLKNIGFVASVKILRDINGVNRGVGFIRMGSEDQAVGAIQFLHDRELIGYDVPLQARLAYKYSKKIQMERALKTAQQALAPISSGQRGRQGQASHHGSAKASRQGSSNNLFLPNQQERFSHRAPTTSWRNQDTKSGRSLTTVNQEEEYEADYPPIIERDARREAQNNALSHMKHKVEPSFRPQTSFSHWYKK